MNSLNNFEKSLRELENIVNQLEHDELSLDLSIKKFEKGMMLAKKCQEALATAEQKITILTINNHND